MEENPYQSPGSPSERSDKPHRAKDPWRAILFGPSHPAAVMAPFLMLLGIALLGLVIGLIVG
jgi:hypothetical protein